MFLKVWQQLKKVLAHKRLQVYEKRLNSIPQEYIPKGRQKAKSPYKEYWLKK